MNEIQGNNLVTDTNGQTDTDYATSIKQDRRGLVLKNSQSKGEDIFNKSISERASSVVGDITKGFFKEFFCAKSKEGAISEEDVSSKQPMLEHMAEENNVDDLIGLDKESEKVTAKKVLNGIAGIFLILPFLIGMGALYIANVFRFAVKKKEDIYAYELNKLLQSEVVENKKQAISYLNEMISKYKEGTVEYDAAKSFLGKNIGQIVACLDPKYTDLSAKTINLLSTMLKNEDTKVLAEETINGKDKGEDFAKKIKGCLGLKNDELKAKAIELLTRMLKNNKTKDVSMGIINSKNNDQIKSCLKSNNSQLMASAVKLLTELLKNNCARTAGKILSAKRIKSFLNSGDQNVITNTIELLTEMLKSRSEDIRNIAKEIIKDRKSTTGEEGLTKKIRNWLESDDPKLKANADLLLRTILNSDNFDNCKFGIQLLIKIVEGNGNDNKAKEIFENGILNLGLIKKMIYDDGCKKEMIKLLSLMSKDKKPNEQNEINGDNGKHLNEIVVDLVGSEIAGKLGKLNLGNDDSRDLNEYDVNEIVKDIKSLRTTIPAKLKEGDIVYKGDFEFDEKLSVLEKDKNTEKISEKILKSFENKDSSEKEDNKTKLKTLLSQNNGLKGDGDKPNSNFLSKKDQEYNKDNNNFDKSKIKESGSADYKRNLVSLKFESEKYILTNGEGEKFLEAFNKVDVQEVSGNKEDNKNNNGDKKEPENVSNLEKFFGRIKNQKGINGNNKNDTFEKLKNRIFSFPGQCTQAAVMTFFEKELGIPLLAISSSYEIVNSRENGTTVTVHNVFTVKGENLAYDPVNLQIVIDEASVFRLNDQEENEYVPITPLESHVNVHEADILYSDDKYENANSTKAVRIGKKITSVDWKNEEEVKKVEK